MANSNGGAATSFVFKRVPDLSYRSHKLSPLGVVTNDAASSFEIRPAFLDRVRVPAVKNGANVSGGRFWLSGSAATMSGETGVTGIPNLVELDDAFNALDPGQLLRESAAAASRMLADPAPDRRASASEMVDELLQQIYAPRTARHAPEEDDAADDADDELSAVAGSHFSHAHSLERKGNSRISRARSAPVPLLRRANSTIKFSAVHASRVASKRLPLQVSSRYGKACVSSTSVEVG